MNQSHIGELHSFEPYTALYKTFVWKRQTFDLFIKLTEVITTEALFKYGSNILIWYSKSIFMFLPVINLCI